MDLFSELRTIYETTLLDPHTFRITIKMKDIIDGKLLREAVDTTMERYPYFRVCLYIKGDSIGFENNPAKVPVIHTKKRIFLGGKQSSGHLIAFCYWKNRLYIDAYHGLTDGGGISHLVKTLLFYYCSSFYGKELSAEGVRLRESVIAKEEWEDPARDFICGKNSLGIKKWNAPAYQLTDSGIVRIKPDSIVYNVRISEEEFMRFNLSNDGSPATIIALFLARTIDALRRDLRLPTVIALCVNQRRALRAPLAHQSLVGDVRLLYDEKLKGLPFSTQATCFRGMVTLQSDVDVVQDEIREYQEFVEILRTLPGHAERRAYCLKRMAERSKCITATVSYVGKANFGEVEHYIQEYEALPSTALPSTHVPLTIEMSALHGYFFINFIQYFDEYDYFSTFLDQLRQNDIDYDVLNVVEARYPRVELPLM